MSMVRDGNDTWHPICPQITWTARYSSQAGDIHPAEVQQEVVVSYLPLSHIAAQIYDLWTGIQWGAQVCFAEPDALKVSVPCHMGVWGSRLCWVWLVPVPCVPVSGWHQSDKCVSCHCTVLCKQPNTQGS